MAGPASPYATGTISYDTKVLQNKIPTVDFTRLTWQEQWVDYAGFDRNLPTVAFWFILKKESPCILVNTIRDHRQAALVCQRGNGYHQKTFLLPGCNKRLRGFLYS